MAFHAIEQTHKALAVVLQAAKIRVEPVEMVPLLID